MISIPQEVKQGYTLKHKKKPYTAVLALHGLLADARDTYLLGTHLHEHVNVDVYGVCVTGSGADPEALRRTHYQEWIESARRVYIDLLDQYQRVLVYGVSMGALLALNLASEKEPSGVICVGAAIDLSDISIKIGGLFGGLSVMFFETVLKKPFLKNQVEPLRKGLVYEDIPVRSVIELYKLIRETKKKIPKVNAPLLILHSKEDKVARPEGAKWLYDHCGSVDKQLVWTVGTHAFLARPLPVHDPLLAMIGRFVDNPLSFFNQTQSLPHSF